MSSAAPRYDETISLPRAVRFPIELIAPAGFDEARPETWPDVNGRLEWFEGRLLYMPPCGDQQQDTVTDVVITLGGWVRSVSGFVLGTNEAGMRLNGATRGADVAVWRKSDVGAYSGGLRRHPPVLAVEVTGPDEDEALLLEKAAWYIAAGVPNVWIVVTDHRRVIVVTASDRRSYGLGERLPLAAELPGLTPATDDLFVQLIAST